MRPNQAVAPGSGQRADPVQHERHGRWRRCVTQWQRDRHEACGHLSMISAVFVDRPRLAIVIAFVITIAGALALMQIPVAQFPDIVPPQVTVTAVFPGASADVVEASVAQPLEAQVVGVDKMLYMKSTSGNDGSYTLTVSFALGTNPDINTVNVNNRVQTALSQLPTEVQAQGLVVQKKSSAVLQFIVLYSKNGEQDPLFITNYAVINVLDAISRTPGRRPGDAVRQTELFDADLVRHPAADQPQPGAVRRDRGDPRPERAGAGRPHRRSPDQRRTAIPVQRADARTADDLDAVRRHRAPRQSRRIGPAHQGRRPGRNRRTEHGQRVADRRPGRRASGHLSRARRQCRVDGKSRPGDARQTIGTVSAGIDL